VDDDTEREERAIYAIVVIAAAPVAIATWLHGPLDGGATLCLCLVCVALAGLWRRRRIPPAELVSRGHRARATPLR